MAHLNALSLYLIILLFGFSFTLSEARVFEIKLDLDGKIFDGIGAISGGGATSRLLIDYPEPQRTQILDYLFLPGFGASLQILKVEIGGDSQSTDGTEASHMHDADTVDLNSGYEWWLMKEAKKRNKNIKLYGLPWAFPGWVGIDPTTHEHHNNPFIFANKTVGYIMEWVRGAREFHYLEIDYLGVWNERASSRAYLELLRSTLDSEGFSNIKLVVRDGDLGICDQLGEDPEYLKVTDIIGLHYPSDYTHYLPTKCSPLGKPIWASEESSSYDDLNGAACWARVLNSHFVLSGITSSLMWNLIGSYYHGLNWYASSLLTAVQPWSGHYGMFHVLWATAHVTQFSQIGWKYAPVGAGSGILVKGGYFTTLFEPSGNDFTIHIVKISHDHAQCTRPLLPKESTTKNELVVFKLDSKLFTGNLTKTVDIWRSNYEKEKPFSFRKCKSAIINKSYPYLLMEVFVGDQITISTVRNASKGIYGPIPKSSPSFPLPYGDTFENYSDSRQPKYLSDQIGSFEIHSDHSGSFLRQMVKEKPIAWADPGRKGPVTVLGMREWQDISVSVNFRVKAKTSAACVGARVDQMWEHGYVFCIWPTGKWSLLRGGPSLIGDENVEQTGSVDIFAIDEWHNINLTVVKGEAYTYFDSRLILFSSINDCDVGFAAIGTNGWHIVDYRNLKLERIGDRWNGSIRKCPTAGINSRIVNVECESNGLTAPDQSFRLLSSWQIQHIPTTLCVTRENALLSLQKCDFYNVNQKFKNDYTQIRNNVKPLFYEGNSTLVVGGSVNGVVKLVPEDQPGYWTKWSYFPNTNSLRNQYTAIVSLGYPRCLSTCYTEKLEMQSISKTK